MTRGLGLVWFVVGLFALGWVGVPWVAWVVDDWDGVGIVWRGIVAESGKDCVFRCRRWWL